MFDSGIYLCVFRDDNDMLTTDGSSPASTTAPGTSCCKPAGELAMGVWATSMRSGFRQREVR